MSVADFNIPKNHDGTIAVYTVQELQLDTFHVYKCWCECYTVIIQIIGVFNQLWDMKEYLMRVCIYIMIIIIKVLANAIVFFLHKIKILISLSNIFSSQFWKCDVWKLNLPLQYSTGKKNVSSKAQVIFIGFLSFQFFRAILTFWKSPSWSCLCILSKCEKQMSEKKQKFEK